MGAFELMLTPFYTDILAFWGWYVTKKYHCHSKAKFLLKLQLSSLHGKLIQNQTEINFIKLSSQFLHTFLLIAWLWSRSHPKLSEYRVLLKMFWMLLLHSNYVRPVLQGTIYLTLNSRIYRSINWKFNSLLGGGYITCGVFF